MKYKIGFIGAGVMAGAIIDRFLEKFDSFNLQKKDIAVYDLAEDKMEKYSALGLTKGESANDILQNAEIVVLGVKPQFYENILRNAPSINAKTFISIMAGVKISTLRKIVGQNVGVCRVMPNTPCAIGKGVMAVCYDNCNEETQNLINAILTTCGKLVFVSEDKFDAVTSISGSGPAYVYLFADAMVQAGIKGGLSLEESKALALATIEGSALYAGKAEYDLKTLVERVCSKGGTTIEAINIFKDNGLENIVGKGIEACREKSKILSEKL